jgi:hypothetical protein
MLFLVSFVKSAMSNFPYRKIHREEFVVTIQFSIITPRKKINLKRGVPWGQTEGGGVSKKVKAPASPKHKAAIKKGTT